MTWDEIAVMEFFDQAVGSRKPLRRIVCKLCHEIIFDLKPGYDHSEMRSETIHCTVHYSIWHDIRIEGIRDAFF